MRESGTAEQDRVPVASHDQGPVALAPRCAPVGTADDVVGGARLGDLEDGLVGVEGVEVEPELLLEEADLEAQAMVHRVDVERLVVGGECLVVAAFVLALRRVLVVLEERGRHVVAPPCGPGRPAHPRARKDRGRGVVGRLAHGPAPRRVPDGVPSGALARRANHVHSDPVGPPPLARDESPVHLVGVGGEGRAQEAEQAAEQVPRVHAVPGQHVEEVTLVGRRRHGGR
jgi:hypothetical protein